MGGSMSEQAFHFFRIIQTPHLTRTRYRYQVFIANSSSQQVTLSHCCTKRVTPLKSSHGHHLSRRAASARATCGRRVDTLQATTAAWTHTISLFDGSPRQLPRHLCGLPSVVPRATMEIGWFPRQGPRLIELPRKCYGCGHGTCRGSVRGKLRCTNDGNPRKSAEIATAVSADVKPQQFPRHSAAIRGN